MPFLSHRPPLALVLAGALALACGQARIDEIRALQDAGEVGRTVEPLREILSRDPGNAEARYRLGLALAQTGQPSLAVAHLRLATDTEEYGVEAGLLLAGLLQHNGSHEQAIQVAEEVLARNPDEPTALALRGHSALAVANPEVALESGDRLLALEPESFQGLSLRALALAALERMDEAEEALAAFSAAAENGPTILGARACVAQARFYADARDDLDRGLEKADACVEEFLPVEPGILPLAIGFYDDAEKPERSTELLRQQLAEQPESLQLRAQLAERMIRADEGAEAEELMREGAELLDTPHAWVTLAALQRSQARPEAALASLDRAGAGIEDPSDEFRFERAAVMIDLGRLDEAEQAAASLREPAYRDLVLGRIALDRGQAAEALELLKKSITAWPNNQASRMAAAHAALALGDLDEAAIQLREAVRIDRNKHDATLQLARVQLERGEYGEALSFARAHLSARGFTGPEAHLIAARAHSARGDFDQAARVLDHLAEVEGQAGLATAERAYLERQHRGVDAALASLEASEIDLTDPANESALRALVDLALQAGRPDVARQATARAAEAHPEHAPFHVLVGRVALAGGDRAGARQGFERARQVDPELPSALVGLGQVALTEGDVESAAELFDAAAQAAPDDPEPAHRAAQAFLLAGRNAEAEKRLDALLKAHPEHASAANDLAWLLAEEGRDLDRALRLAQRAQRVLPSPEVLDTVGWVHLQRGELDLAIEAFQQGLAARPNFPTARYHLGVALARRGDEEAARRELERALGEGPFPEAEAARAQLARLDVGGTTGVTR